MAVMIIASVAIVIFEETPSFKDEEGLVASCKPFFHTIQMIYCNYELQSREMQLYDQLRRAGLLLLSCGGVVL